MTEDETELGEMASRRRSLVVHALFSVAKQSYRLFGFLYEILDEYAEVFAVVQRRRVVFVVLVDRAQVLVGVREDVEDEWGAVL